MSPRKTTAKCRGQWYCHVRCEAKNPGKSSQYDDIFGCRTEISFIFYTDHFICDNFILYIFSNNTASKKNNTASNKKFKFETWYSQISYN